MWDRDPVRVFRLRLSDPENLTYETLARLKRYVDYFSVAMYKQNVVYLTGGREKAERSVYEFELNQNKWRVAKSMNEGRYGHSSIFLD